MWWAVPKATGCMSIVQPSEPRWWSTYKAGLIEEGPPGRRGAGGPSVVRHYPGRLNPYRKPIFKVAIELPELGDMLVLLREYGSHHRGRVARGISAPGSHRSVRSR